MRIQIYGGIIFMMEKDEQDKTIKILFKRVSEEGPKVMDFFKYGRDISNKEDLQSWIWDILPDIGQESLKKIMED